MLNALRPKLGRVLAPVGHALARTGLTPNVITVVGTLGVVVGALAFYPRGELFVGTLVIAISALLDMLDGALARAQGVLNPWGAFLDSCMDRIADAAIFGGLALWFTGAGDAPVLAALAVFCLAGSLLVSYAKARAESLGLRCDIGLAERGERLLVGLVAIGLSGLGVPYILVVGLTVLGLGITVTVIQRFATVRRQATAPGAEHGS